MQGSLIGGEGRLAQRGDEITGSASPLATWEGTNEGGKEGGRGEHRGGERACECCLIKGKERKREREERWKGTVFRGCIHTIFKSRMETNNHKR